jgi:hypothetical protein
MSYYERGCRGGRHWRLWERGPVGVFRWLGDWPIIIFAIFGAGSIVGAVAATNLAVTVTFAILASLFLVVGMVFQVRQAEAAEERARQAQQRVWQEVLTAGIAGTATITGVQTTGIEDDDEPQYRVTVNVALPDRLIYQATVTKALPPTSMSRYEPGAVFPCRVKPDDLSMVILIDKEEHHADIARGSTSATLANGLPGKATVLGVFTPPFTDPAGPLWGLRLQIVASDGRPPYALKLATLYPAGRKRPLSGDRLAVKIDPEEPRLVAVDWLAPKRPRYDDQRRI